jgi:exopolysaccharide production protein ExoQ
MGSRFVSQWLNVATRMESPEAYLEGSPLDMFVFVILIAAGLFVLLRRKIFWSEVLRGNVWIFGLLLYAGMSVIWSDFAFVAFKRWVKEIGNMVMVLTVLSEHNPVEAIKTLIRRCAYVLIPLSIVLYKYFPAMGRMYNRWSGESMMVGVASSKNELGLLCLVCALFFLWDMLSARQNKAFSLKERKTFFDILILIMTIWLLINAKSATSVMCFMVGAFILISMELRIIKANLKAIDLFMIFGLLIFLALELVFDIHEVIILGLGREQTLTGRSDFWKELIPMTTSPVFGTGYESFWLGPRVEEIWGRYWWHPNQAHNGYVEVYLNLGMLGLFFLAGLIASVYKKIRQGLISEFVYGRFRLTFLAIALIYNFSEAGFKGLHLMWFIFLIIGIEYPRLYGSEVRAMGKDFSTHVEHTRLYIYP